MANNLVEGPNVAIAKSDTSFVTAGLTEQNCLKVIEVGTPPKSHVFGEDLNAIDGFKVNSRGYYIIMHEAKDLSAFLTTRLNAVVEPPAEEYTNLALAGNNIEKVGSKYVPEDPTLDTTVWTSNGLSPVSLAENAVGELIARYTEGAFNYAFGFSDENLVPNHYPKVKAGFIFDENEEIIKAVDGGEIISESAQPLILNNWYAVRRSASGVFSLHTSANKVSWTAIPYTFEFIQAAPEFAVCSGYSSPTSALDSPQQKGLA